MKQAGAGCADDLLKLCESSSGRQLENIDGLVGGWNILRDSPKLEGRWEYENNTAHGIFNECGCPLVRSGRIELDPTQCLCSHGMMEIIFAEIAKRTARVEMRRAVGRGDGVCEFVVPF